MAFGGPKRGGPGGARGKDAKAGDKDGGQRRGGGFFRRRKVCKFCADKIDYINYKDVKLLAPLRARARQDPAAPHLGHLRACTSASCRRPSSARASSRCCRTRRTKRSTRHHGSHSPGPRRPPRASAATSSRSPTATPATTCCRASWRCRRPTGNKQQIERERKIAEAREAEERGAAEALADAAGGARPARSPARSARTTRCTGR